MPAGIHEWLRRTDNEITAFGLSYGRGHVPERMWARNWFAQKHDRLEEAWPIDRIRSWWEELTWRWWEEIKTSYRELVLQMGGINPSKDDLKSQALAPSPDGLSVFRMPTAFQLLDPKAYFQTVCMARQDRQHQRMMAKQFNDHLTSASKKKTKAAGEDICKVYISTGGRCYRGDTCRFAHPPGLPPPPTETSARWI